MRVVAAIILATAAAIVPAGASELPAPLSKAIAAEAPWADFRASFSMRATAPDAAQALVLHYDAPGDAWTVLEGDLDRLDEETRTAISAMQEELTEPGELTYHDMKDDLNGAVLDEETADSLIYHLDINHEDSDMPKKMREAIRPLLFVNKADGTVSRFSVSLTEPVKPAAIARIDDMTIEQDFAPLPDGPTVLRRYYNKITGNAMFQDFSEEFTLEFFDFVPLAQ